MDYLTIPGVSLPVSRLVMGSVNFFVKDQESSDVRLDAWVKAGGNVIDTGRIYGGGESEQVIGNWLASRGVRDNFIVLTKGCHPHGKTRRVTREALESDITGSLEALQTDRIDIFLMHRDDVSVPVAEIMGWLNEQKEAGTVGTLGVSNWTRARVEAANDFAKENGLSAFEVVSNYAGLATTNEPMWWECIEMDADYRNWHIETQTPNICWSSLSHGFFSGKQNLDDTVHAEIVRTYDNAENWERLHRVTELGRSRNLSTAQIACSYVLSQKYPSLAVAAPDNLEELAGLIEASDVTLHDDELDWLEGN
jgi:aryl-alcohol dehydrogenase-like predicted oxidoreductase